MTHSHGDVPDGAKTTPWLIIAIIIVLAIENALLAEPLLMQAHQSLPNAHRTALSEIAKFTSTVLTAPLTSLPVSSKTDLSS